MQPGHQLRSIRRQRQWFREQWIELPVDHVEMAERREQRRIRGHFADAGRGQKRHVP